MSPQNNQPKISLLLLTKNEQGRVGEWPSWLKKCHTIDEIICIDDLSTDETAATVKDLRSPSLAVNIFSRALDGDFASQRQFGLSKCKNDWVLWLDADEIPSQGLINFLNDFQPSSDFNFAFPRADIFLGQTLRHGETANMFFTRLFNKHHGFFVGKVHEVWSSDTTIRKTNTPILHCPHHTLSSFLNKINFYSDIRSLELFNQKTKTNLFQIALFPLAKFVHNYIFRLGFLDSTAGIIIALGMSLHSFLVRAKLWHLWQKQSSTLS